MLLCNYFIAREMPASAPAAREGQERQGSATGVQCAEGMREDLFGSDQWRRAHTRYSPSMLHAAPVPASHTAREAAKGPFLWTREGIMKRWITWST